MFGRALSTDCSHAPRERVECVVVGAGVVGLAVARELAKAGREVWVIEGATDIGTGTSSRNSEVVHAGIYYPQGSLKVWMSCIYGVPSSLHCFYKIRIIHQHIGLCCRQNSA